KVGIGNLCSTEDAPQENAVSSSRGGHTDQPHHLGAEAGRSLTVQENLAQTIESSEGTDILRIKNIISWTQALVDCTITML
ncbi:hypothetical protein ACQP3C_27025, partial [Escherichia coli]